MKSGVIICFFMLVVPLVAPFSLQRPSNPNRHLQLKLPVHTGRAGLWRSKLNLSTERTAGAQSGETSGNMSPDVISQIPVVTDTNDKVLLGSLLPNDPEETVILACLSHFGDFNAWEVTQQYVTAMNDDKFGSDCKTVLVGIGSADAARQFASDLSLNNSSRAIKLVADEKGAVTDALGCYRGWLSIDKTHAKKWPATDVSPYFKLFGMIFGLGSPGTMEKVLYGYIGDESGGTRSRKWVIDALLQGSKQGRWPRITEKAFEGIPIDSGLRPFELATLRAQTGLHIVLNWRKLGPKDGDLFTRMGCTIVFRGNEVEYLHYDKGILTYAPLVEVIAAANAAGLK